MELKPFADSMNLSLVDVQKNVHGAKDVQVAIVIASKEGETSIDDCEKFHRTVQSRLEMLIGRDELSMEVSTPGLQRNFRDIWEFEVFNGKRCRVYDTSRSQWVEGNISACDQKTLTLLDYFIEDTGETGSYVEIELTDVHKAKLEYKFENKKVGDK